MRSETAYQRKLINKLQRLFPDCFIMRNPPSEVQGIPDVLILFGTNWAMLEVKRSLNEDIQPNQEYYINLFNDMAFASFICPETEEQVLNELQLAFGVTR